jgi:hypothetical protein
VNAIHAERHARGFTCWGQFVAMLFCQLGRAHSLREIVGGLASCEGRLAHLGITVPRRSTLAYANAHRPWQWYQAVFYQLLARCQGAAGGKKFRFKNKLLSLDATLIELCADMFPWATFRRTKGAVKLHFTLDHDGYLPTVLVITEGKRRETPVAREQRFAPGTILVFDRGYLKVAWFAELTAAGVYFVTRLKTTTRYRVVRRRPVPQHRNILVDQEIQLRRRLSRRQYPQRLRRVVLRTPDGDRLEFLTNHLRLGASTVGAHLSRPVANRALLQGAQTEPPREDVCRYLGERPPHSNLDRADRPAHSQVLAAQGALWVGVVESRRAAADESVCLSRPLGVAQRTLHRPPGADRTRPTGVGLRVTWTAHTRVSPCITVVASPFFEQFEWAQPAPRANLDSTDVAYLFVRCWFRRRLFGRHR